MEEYLEKIENARKALQEKLSSLENPQDIFKSAELKGLFDMLKSASPEHKPVLGKKINELRTELTKLVNEKQGVQTESKIIDPTAPFDVNVKPEDRPELFDFEVGSRHPLMVELERALDIFRRMGFETYDPRQLDDDHHVFGTLNFPVGHPARDNWDTFVTDEGFLPIPHTTAMDNRLLQSHEPPIAAVVGGRCYRNEDLDATHEHTFYQVDGVLVDTDVTMGDMLGTFKKFFEEFFGEQLKIKTQPAYFPFVEPGLEYMISKPASLGGKDNEWLEVMGCGMLHPNVLKAAGLDPFKYRGFAWGFGLDRLVLLKYGIEDIRHLESGRLEFLRKIV